MIRKLRLILFVFTIILISATNRILAQETTSSMSGTVSEKGGALPGATITALHVPTGTKYTTSTRSDGGFNLSGLRVGGPYIISVSFIGYSTESQENINLTLGENYNAKFLLKETSVTLKTVIVKTGQNKTFNSNHTGNSDIVSRTQIERLPTISRSLADVTKLTPYASGGQANSYGGRNNLYNNITVNGAQFNNTFGLSGTIGGQSGANPISLDAIEQIQVNVSPYDVSQGGFTGAGVNSLTKAGTNSFYGTLYGYYQAPNLAGTHVGAFPNLATQQFNYNLEGISLGFPIIINKLFFFINAERERKSFPVTNFMASTPSNPYSGANGSIVSQPNATTLDSLKNFLITKFGYDPGTYQGYNYNFYRNNVTARFDLNISPRSTASLNLFYLHSYKDVNPSNSGSFNGGRQPSLFTLPFSGAGYRINNDLYSGIFELNSRYSNSLSNKFQAGFTAERDYRASLGSGVFPEVDILGGANTLPEVTSFGYEPFTAHNMLNSNIYQINDYFKVYSGKHEITVGTQNQIQSYQNGFSPNYNGSYVFNSLTDFYNSANNGVDNTYQYKLSYSALSPDFPIAKVKNVQLGFFGQDKITIDPRFTLTLGLRADIPIVENTFTDNPGVDKLTFQNGIKVGTGQVPNTKVLLSPRVGFNWDVSGDRSFQIRGGTGVFTGPPPQVWLANQAINNGVQFGSFQITSKSAKGGGIGFPFSSNVDKYRPTPDPKNLSPNYSIAISGKNFNFPQVWRSSLGFDYKLPFNINASLEGFYTQDINAVYFTNINIGNSKPLSGVDNRPRYTTSQIYNGAGGATLSNPNISTAILLKNTNKGYSYAVSIKLERNVKNLYTALTFTTADSRSVSDGGSISASSWSGRPVSGEVNADALGYSSYRVPNRLFAIANYKFEYAHFLATTLGITYELQPGGSYSYTYGGDLNNDGISGNDLWYIPIQQSDINLVDYTPKGTTVKYLAIQQWADLNNYINQDPYLRKNRGQYAERNGLLAPYYNQLNLNFGEDLFIQLKNGKRNILRFTADIINFQNLLNQNWGVRQSPVGPSSIIAAKGIVAGLPTFNVNYLNPATVIPFTSTFQQNTASIWQAQLGIRYIFQ